MNIFDISKQKAEKLFPNETWTEVYKNVFVAKNRKPINSERKKVFQKELLMAKIASNNSHVVYLLPEDCQIQDKKNPVLRGVLLQKENTGIVYCYVSCRKTMYCWKMIDLK